MENWGCNALVHSLPSLFKVNGTVPVLQMFGVHFYTRVVIYMIISVMLLITSFSTTRNHIHRFCIGTSLATCQMLSSVPLPLHRLCRGAPTVIFFTLLIYLVTWLRGFANERIDREVKLHNIQSLKDWFKHILCMKRQEGKYQGL